ncbi:protein farnesyltransferase/geranylgeranyltransferase type-1 subunit alpha [Orussus abietinus]|uniref:protein farnesyltransferase/geranylgeranyltransferase type-1 subunit alpha n=1 Tax=Orussus abietinus TaxID=222816 RepID=UPI000625E024|nr:protein farnesyltransferase/geranylgeranyltransferase type-1 subunit alpha [Orussus abietinus]
MSDSSEEDINSDENDRADAVLYSEMESWNDVEPVPQDDGPNPIVAIAYSKRFKDAYDYFRAVLKSGEKSDRVLELTKDCGWLNPANYTVWQFRREVLKALGKDLKEELRYIEKIIKANTKNYQVWYHRRVIVEWLQDPSEELVFTEAILKHDSKNYHAWQHRQWCIKAFELYDKELAYVEYLLDKDVRNNSAWNQRYFVLKETTEFKQDVIDREVDFTLEKIMLVKNNESAWSYLRGILMHDAGGLGRNEKVAQLCQKLYNENCRSNHLLSCIIDICQERHGHREESPDSFYNINFAINLCKELAKEYDKIRRMYWDYIRQQLLEKVKEEP